MSTEEIKITPELIEQHGLSQEEYRRIKSLLGREPNYTELGIFSVMWSEHCSYKSSKAILKKFPTTGEQIIQGPGENAGVVAIDDDLAMVFKIESHNHPSYIEPYQGAATGVGGIIRDIFTMGARPIACLNSLRFGPLENPKNRYLMSRVVAGIAGYGNCMGIPTVGGEVFFEECYSQNPLVNAFCLGIAHRERIFYARACGDGNPVIYVGSSTGRDGIHGATMASEEFNEQSEERRPTVQVGDPFTEKLLLEACLELMKTDYIVGIQDMGAAGLTCSNCEMAGKGGAGVDIDLGLVPVRETGMTPYEIMLSESQERMLLVAQKGKEKEVEDIFSKWDLHGVTIGRVTGDGHMRVKENGRLVADIPALVLSEEAPVYHNPKKRPAYVEEIQAWKPEHLPEPSDLTKVLENLLGSPSIGSKGWVFEQYDHMVRINTILLPGGDAAVLRIMGTPKAIGMTLDGNGRYCYLDPRMGGRLAVAEAARNLVCTGTKPLAITNCLNFGDPENPEVMWQFDEAVEGISEACRCFKTPVTGGNVSFYNQTLGEPIFPTPVIGMVGLVQDVQTLVTPWFKDDGDLICLIGQMGEDLGGSEYLKAVHGLIRGKPPGLDLAFESKVQTACLRGIELGIIKSAHDCSEGGLAVALAESCFSPFGLKGAEVTLDRVGRPDALLFGETPSRILVTIDEKRMSEWDRLATRIAVPWQAIGKVGGDQMKIGPWIKSNVKRLQFLWE
ncbi:MAG: phosphoribosylformylglycinamidine synthase subunit PurL, partial [bacterium]